MFRVATTISFLGCFAAFCITAGTQVSRTGQGFLFRCKYVPGATYSYAIHLNVQRPGQAPLAITGPFVEKVKKTIESGGVLAVSYGPLRSGPDLNHIVLPSQQYEFSQDRLGNVKSTTVVPQMSVVFSTLPVKLGASWDGTASGQSMGSESKIKARYTLKKFTRTEGHDVAQIAVKFSATGQADTSGSGSIEVLRSDGSLWSSDSQLAMTSPKGDVMRIHVTMTRK